MIYPSMALEGTLQLHLGLQLWLELFLPSFIAPSRTVGTKSRGEVTVLCGLQAGHMTPCDSHSQEGAGGWVVWLEASGQE